MLVVDGYHHLGFRKGRRHYPAENLTRIPPSMPLVHQDTVSERTRVHARDATRVRTTP